MTCTHIPTGSTPIVLYDNGDRDHRQLPAEPFPTIRRDVLRRGPRKDAKGQARTSIRYTLGRVWPDDAIVSSSPLIPMDAGIPIGTDLEAVDEAMHALAYWRGSLHDAPAAWRRGADRVWTLHRFPHMPGTPSHLIVRKGFHSVNVETLDGLVQPWTCDHLIQSVVAASGLTSAAGRTPCGIEDEGCTA